MGGVRTEKSIFFTPSIRIQDFCAPIAFPGTYVPLDRILDNIEMLIYSIFLQSWFMNEFINMDQYSQTHHIVSTCTGENFFSKTAGKTFRECVKKRYFRRGKWWVANKNFDNMKRKDMKFLLLLFLNNDFIIIRMMIKKKHL